MAELLAQFVSPFFWLNYIVETGLMIAGAWVFGFQRLAAIGECNRNNFTQIALEIPLGFAG